MGHVLISIPNVYADASTSYYLEIILETSVLLGLAKRRLYVVYSGNKGE